MLRTNCLVVGSSLLFLAIAQPLHPQTASGSPVAITIHRSVNRSCELVQSAQLKDNGNYASVVIPDATELYSPELAKDDFLVSTVELPGKLAKLARKSGFRVQHGADATNNALPNVIDVDGRDNCPTLEEALQIAERNRIERRRQVRSKLYRPGVDDVTVPTAVSTQQPELATASNPSQRKQEFQGTVVLAVIVGADGTVLQVRVVRSLSPELDQRAVDAVRNWKFQPARKDGLAVPVQIPVEVSFRD